MKGIKSVLAREQFLLNLLEKQLKFRLCYLVDKIPLMCE